MQRPRQPQRVGNHPSHGTPPQEAAMANNLMMYAPGGDYSSPYNSGFTTVILNSFHIHSDGSVWWNDTEVVAGNGTATSNMPALQAVVSGLQRNGIGKVLLSVGGRGRVQAESQRHQRLPLGVGQRLRGIQYRLLGGHRHDQPSLERHSCPRRLRGAPQRLRSERNRPRSGAHVLHLRGAGLGHADPDRVGAAAECDRDLGSVHGTELVAGVWTVAGRGGPAGAFVDQCATPGLERRGQPRGLDQSWRL